MPAVSPSALLREPTKLTTKGQLGGGSDGGGGGGGAAEAEADPETEGADGQ